jgi:hypothetical protein
MLLLLVGGQCCTGWWVVFWEGRKSLLLIQVPLCMYQFQLRNQWVQESHSWRSGWQTHRCSAEPVTTSVLIGTPDSAMGGRISSPANWRRDLIWVVYVYVLVQILAWNLKRGKSSFLPTFLEFCFVLFCLHGVCKTRPHSCKIPTSFKL